MFQPSQVVQNFFHTPCTMPPSWISKARSWVSSGGAMASTAFDCNQLLRHMAIRSELSSLSISQLAKKSTKIRIRCGRTQGIDPEDDARPQLFTRGSRFRRANAWSLLHRAECLLRRDPVLDILQPLKWLWFWLVHDEELRSYPETGYTWIAAHQIHGILNSRMEKASRHRAHSPYSLTAFTRNFCDLPCFDASKAFII